jgi:hypothetical protein
MGRKFQSSVIYLFYFEVRKRTKQNEYKQKQQTHNNTGRMAMRRINKRPKTESSNDNKYNFSTMKRLKRMKIGE